MYPNHSKSLRNLYPIMYIVSKWYHFWNTNRKWFICALYILCSHWQTIEKCKLYILYYTYITIKQTVLVIKSLNLYWYHIASITLACTYISATRHASFLWVVILECGSNYYSRLCSCSVYVMMRVSTHRWRRIDASLWLQGHGRWHCTHRCCYIVTAVVATGWSSSIGCHGSWSLHSSSRNTAIVTSIIRWIHWAVTTVIGIVWLT